VSKPTPPDGSDPRVLVPDEDEPLVTIVSNDRSSYDTYHTHPERCDKINRTSKTREVKQSIAEWQGNDLCDRCAELDAAPESPIDVADATHTPGEPVTPATCHALRREVARGHDPTEVGSAIGMSKSTAYVHLRGECSHNIAHAPLVYDEDASAWRADL